MRNRFYIAIMLILIPLTALAQASGGQITRKKPTTSGSNVRSNTPLKQNSNAYVQTQSEGGKILPISIDRLGPYNIVVCTYSYLSSAQDECRKIRNNGYSSDIFLDSSDKYRVLMFSSANDVNTAIVYRNQASQMYPTAWIMCIENGRTHRYSTPEDYVSTRSRTKYNVVAKTFSTLSGAQDECRSIRNNGYMSDIYIESSGTYRVLIYLGTNSLQDAISYRNAARKLFPAAWIMCIENGRTYRYD